MEHETSSLTVAQAVSDESDRVSIQQNPAHENAGADCPAAPTAPSRSSASLYSRKKKEIAPAGTGFGAADPYSTTRNEACVPDPDDMVRLDDEFVFTNKREGCLSSILLKFRLTKLARLLCGAVCCLAVLAAVAAVVLVANDASADQLPAPRSQAAVVGAASGTAGSLQNFTVSGSLAIHGTVGVDTILAGIAAGVGTRRELIRVDKIRQDVKSNLSFSSAQQPQVTEIHVALSNLFTVPMGNIVVSSTQHKSTGRRRTQGGFLVEYALTADRDVTPVLASGFERRLANVLTSTSGRHWNVADIVSRGLPRVTTELKFSVFTNPTKATAVIRSIQKGVAADVAAISGTKVTVAVGPVLCGSGTGQRADAATACDQLIAQLTSEDQNNPSQSPTLGPTLLQRTATPAMTAHPTRRPSQRPTAQPSGAPSRQEPLPPSTTKGPTAIATSQPTKASCGCSFPFKFNGRTYADCELQN